MTDQAEKARLFAPLLAQSKAHFRANTDATEAKPIDFVKGGAQGAEVVPYEKHGFSRFPKPHMTDPVLQAVMTLAKVIGDNVGVWEANQFYRQCWFSRNGADLTAKFTPWADRLKILGLLT